MKKDYFEQIRNGSEITFRDQLYIIAMLSIPAILSEISTVIMEYVDQSMVGRLGQTPSAAIGLISSSTWLIGGLCRSVTMGFTVQVAHNIGAKKYAEARAITKHGITAIVLFSAFIAMICVAISARLPYWLGGTDSIAPGATTYFRIFALALPLIHLNGISSLMLQSSGNIKTPSILNVVGCFLNVFFNFLLIFPTRQIIILGKELSMPGFGLGIAGAALGTAIAEGIIAFTLLYFLLVKSPILHLRKERKLPFSLAELQAASKIAIPFAIEQGIMGWGYVMATRIVSPLGEVSLAANSFSVTAESLCYMPGYGIASAATALIGQSLGAGRGKLAQRLGWLATATGMLVMTCTGVLMYIFAPQILAMLTPVPEIQALGAKVLRIEAFAEPMFAASIVATGVFRGAGDTLGPSIINFISMWAVRLTMAFFLAPILGLEGVWIAMCTDLCVRGALFLIRMVRRPVSKARSVAGALG
jgi:putative MATE family efflux protein